MLLRRAVGRVRHSSHDATRPSRSSLLKVFAAITISSCSLIALGDDEKSASIRAYLVNKLTNGIPEDTQTVLESQPVLIPAYRQAQPAVTSSTTNSDSVFLTIHLSRCADFETCAAVVARVVQSHEYDAAVGFGARVWDAVHKNVPAGYVNLDIPTSMPSTGGDIFLHCKANDKATCVKMAKNVLENLPEGAIYDAEDVYGYHETKDWSVSSCENDRYETAVVPTTGGSFLLAQQWRHDHLAFDSIGSDARDLVIGKHGSDYLYDTTDLSIAICNGLPENSHVAKVTVLDPLGKQFKIVRQGMSCGSLAPGSVSKNNIHEYGSFFVGYSRDPMIFNYMLGRMTVSKAPDALLRFNKCIRSQLYYVPSVQQLKALATSH